MFSKQPQIRNLSKVSNALFVLCLTPSVAVTLLNWTAVVDYSSYIEPGNPDDIQKLFIDLHLHGVLLMLCLVDYALSMFYLTFSSIAYILCIIMVYLIWSVIHYAAGWKDPFGNRYIYPLLNWEYPQSAIPVSFVATLAVCGLHCLFSWIKYKYILRPYVTTAHLKRISVQERVHSSSQPSSNQPQNAEEQSPVSPSNDANGHDHDHLGASTNGTL